MRVGILGDDFPSSCHGPDHEGVHGTLDVVGRMLLGLEIITCLVEEIF